MLKQFLKDNWSILLISSVIIAFFLRLFFPTPSLFVNPDFGRSDLINFNIPIKTIMSQAIREGRLPLWEPKIGQGFPILEEGQIGFFYPPNLILFALFPFWLAFNLGYITTFAISAFGTYSLARSLKISREGSTLAALTYAFCPMFVLHFHHYNFIQTLSLFPWVLYFINEFFQTNKYRNLLFTSTIIALQVSTGFQQITAYSITGGLIFLAFKLTRTRASNRTKIKMTALVVSFILLGLAIAAVQIVQTYTLSRQADRTTTITPLKILSEFPYKTSNILTVFNPYIHGNPKDGTYPTFQTGRWGIFWENTTYFGLVQLILASTICVFSFLKPKKVDRQLVTFLVFFAFLGIVLSLGNSAPLHPLFSFPPFSIFRVPSRFLMFTFISVSLLAALGLDKIPQKKHKSLKIVLVSTLIALAILDIFRVWYSYGQTVAKERVLEPSLFARKIDNNYRLFSYGIENEWTKAFTDVGWQNNNYRYYTFLENSLAENSNILSNINQQKAYAGIKPKRSEIINSFLEGAFQEKDGKLSIKRAGENLFVANNVRYLTTVLPLDQGDWVLVDKINYDEKRRLYLWQNNKALSRAYVASGYQIALTIPEFGQLLQNENIDISKTPILEEDIGLLASETSKESNVKILKSENTQVELEANLSKKSLVVLSDSYYPGWEAYVDDKKTKIYPANINSRAVIVESGTHKIKYVYNPTNIKIGGLISIFSILATVALLKYLISRKLI